MKRNQFRITPRSVHFATIACGDKNKENLKRSLYMGWDSDFFCDLVLSFRVGVGHDDAVAPSMEAVENIDHSASIRAVTVPPVLD